MTYPKICAITPEEYQTKLRELSDRFNIEIEKQFLVYVCGVSEESREVLGLMKRYFRGDLDYIDVQTSLRKEVGDLIAYAILLATYFDLDFEDILLTNLEKIERRIESGKHLGQGSDR